MKYLLLVTMLSFGILSTTCAQKQTAPAVVKAAFKAKFPTVQKTKWGLEAAGEWEAEFKTDGKEMSANFSTDGTWLETEAEIKTADLPQAVKDAIAAQFAGYEMEEASLVQTTDMAAGYEVEMEKGETTIEVLFNADGTVVKQTNGTEDDDDGDDGDGK